MCKINCNKTVRREAKRLHFFVFHLNFIKFVSTIFFLLFFWCHKSLWHLSLKLKCLGYKNCLQMKFNTIEGIHNFVFKFFCYIINSGCFVHYTMSRVNTLLELFSFSLRDIIQNSFISFHKNELECARLSLNISYRISSKGKQHFQVKWFI